MDVVLSLLSKSLCGPVGGQEPKDQSACRVSGNATAVASTKPSGTGSATGSLPFTGDAGVVRFPGIENLGAAVLGLFMGFLV